MPAGVAAAARTACMLFVTGHVTLGVCQISVMKEVRPKGSTLPQRGTVRVGSTCVEGVATHALSLSLSLALWLHATVG